MMRPIPCGLYYVRREKREYYSWRDLIPLEECVVEATVIDQCCQVDITQSYKNGQDQEVEACYLFPLDERAAVCGFEAEVDGRRIVGEAKEKKEAASLYKNALAAGEGAFLLEQQRPDVFMVRVGSIPGRGAVQVKITYVAELKSEELAKRFLLPTIVAPRYCPPSREDPDDSAAQPLESRGAMYRLRLSLSAMMISNISAVTSPSHEISSVIEEGDRRRAKVEFKAEQVCMDRDVVIHIVVEEPQNRPAFFERTASGSVAGMVSVFPRFDAQDMPVEAIFVLDRSGSMAGSRITQAQAAMQLFLRSLPEACYFNIVGFGSRFEVLFKDGSRKYDDKALRFATGRIRKMGSNLGGTELVEPLNFIFAQTPVCGFARQVFVLTDGEVSNTNEVIQLVRQHSGRCRVFSLGIGKTVSHHLVEGVARAGRGTAEFVTDAASMQGKVMKQLKAALQPALHNVRVDWGTPQCANTAEFTEGSGKVIHQTPFCPPPVIDGMHFLVYAIYGKENELPPQVVILADSPTGPLRMEIPVEPERTITGNLLHTMAARSMIRDLEEGRSWLQQTGYSRSSTEVRNEVVRLGTTYQLVSSRTSFVAVDERTRSYLCCRCGPVPTNPSNAGLRQRQERRLKARPASGKDSLEGDINLPVFAKPADLGLGEPSVAVRALAPPPAPGSLAGRLGSPQLEESDDEDDDDYLEYPEEYTYGAGASTKREVEETKKVVRDPKKAKVLNDIVLEQAVNGAFPFSNKMGGLLGLETSDLVAIVDNHNLDPLEVGVAKKVAMTVATIAYLETHLASFVDSWELMMAKAKRFAMKHLSTTKVSYEDIHQSVVSKMKKT